MNKTLSLFLVVVSLIALSVGMLFYDLDPVIVDHTDNITFRDTKLENPFKNRNLNEQMVATVDRSFHRDLNVKRYQGKLVADINSPSANGAVTYVNGDLSLMSNGAMSKKVALFGNNQPAYSRFIVDNSSSQMVANVAGYQSLHIRQAHSHVQVHGYQGVVETGGMFATVADHDHELDLEHGGCTHDGCDATFDWEAFYQDAVIGGITSDKLDEYWKVPLGDVLLPMLLMVLGYLLLVFIKRH